MSATFNADVDNEPFLFTRFMPGCSNCKAIHPLARTPPIHSQTCPDCGTPVLPPGEPVAAKAKITGFAPAILLGRAMRALGRAIYKFAERL